MNLTPAQKAIFDKLGNDWYFFVGDLFDESKINDLRLKIRDSYRSEQVIRPHSNQIFRAFKECPLDYLKVVIVGQDPYPNHHANGIAFSSEIGYPKSLMMIFQQLDAWMEEKKRDPSLLDWCRQGVLLLNSRLTVVEGSPGSHRKFGWESLMQQVIHRIAKDREDIAFIAMGGDAERIMNPIFERTSHFYKALEHPAFAAREKRDWSSDNVFGQVNQYLELMERNTIEW